ncbi:MAG: hypothetical protein J3R72DRAFT_481024 [Linnemannia gamsii]|nr:MAG: hypothetical protein J3R72DRAFT_481024 [Linnemannia gamsii]
MAPNARVSLDADLMTQTVPCSVFPSNSAASFSAVSDSQSQPLLFSVSQDGILYLLHADNSTGRKPLVNLNECFGVPAGAVTAHATNQDNMCTIYLAFSTLTTVYVVRPTKTLEWMSVKAGDNLASWLLTGKPQTQGTVKKILMAKKPDDTGYPLLVIGHTNSNGKSLDMSHITVDIASKTWEYNSLLVPFAEEWTYMCCGYLDITFEEFHGTRCLFGFQKENDETFIKVVAVGVPMFRPLLVAPPGASAMDTFINEDGHSDLLIASTEGIHHCKFLAVEYPSPSIPMTSNLVTTDPIFTSSQELRVVQTHSHLSVWAENGSNDIVYQQFDLTMVQKTPAVPLLTRQQGGGAFAVHLDPYGSQNLFAVDDKSRLTRLTQDSKTRLWRHLPILVPSIGLNEDFTSFTSHINVADSNGNALAASTVLLCSSFLTDLAVNGEPLAVGPEGVPVLTDRRGNLTVIHRVDDIASVVLTIKDAPGNPSVLGQPYTLNPAKKVQEGLAKVTDAASLKSVTLPDGSKLLDGSPATADMIARAGTAIGQLHKHMQSLPCDGSLQSASLKSVSTSNALVEASSDETLWDLWHWLANGAESIEDWAVNAVEGAAHWVITTAKGVFKFVLDSITHVLKAAGWVLQQVVKGVEKIIQWVGFLFQWDDILATHNDFVQVVNDVLGCAPAAFEVLEENVEAWFGHLKQSIQSLDSKSKHMTQRYDATSAAALGADTGPINKATHSPGANWSFYQVEHGGVGNSLTAIDKSATDAINTAQNDPFADIWKEIMAALKDMETDLSKFWKDLTKNFSSSKSFSLADVFTDTGIDIAVTLVDFMQHIVVGFLKVTDLIVSTLKTTINTPLNIPLLSPLYKKMTNGKELTLLDAISLLIAIPTTVMYKLIHGHSPTSTSSSSSPSSLLTTVEPTIAYTNEITVGTNSTKHSGVNTVICTAGGKEEGMLEKLLKILGNIPKMYAPQLTIASYCVNLFQTCSAPGGWEELTTGPFQVTKSAIGWLVSIPLPNSSPRPGLGWRFTNFGLGFITVLGCLSIDPVIRGGLGSIVSFLQLVPVSMSIYLDTSATQEEYPKRDNASLVSNTIDRLMNQVAMILSNVCVIEMGKDPYTGIAAMAAAIVKLGAQTVSLVEEEEERVVMYGF